MKKILLTSDGFKNPKIGEEFLRLVGKKAEDIKVVFVPTASQSDQELFYVNQSRQELLDLGVNAINIKELQIDHEIDVSEIDGYDAIYVCGGNTFYLLKHVRMNDFDEAIRYALDKGFVYVGVSAGSIIMGPTIETAKIGGALGADVNEVDLEDLSGVDVVDFAISPHYIESDKKDIDELGSIVSCDILPLADGEAVTVEGGNRKVIK